MGDLVEFRPKSADQKESQPDAVHIHLHSTMETIAECLNIFKQAHPTFANTELLGSVMFLLVKNESRLENGVTLDRLLAACRNHQAKGP